MGPPRPSNTPKDAFQKSVSFHAPLKWLAAEAGGLLCDFPDRLHTLHTASAPCQNASNTCWRDPDDTQSHSELVGNLLVHLALGLGALFP